jgi:two-component sensor histidine kinase
LLDALTRAQFAHIQDLLDARIVTDGPRVKISSAAAQTIGMALHELLTNAIKHGSLCNADGRIDVRWRLDAQGGDEHLFMSWSETDGPPVAPPKRRGFGSMVIDSMVKTSLDADVEVAYAPTGFSWRLSCAAARVLQFGEEAKVGSDR